MRIRKAIAAITVSVALAATAACGPQVVECGEDNVICTNEDGGQYNGGDRDDDDFEGEDDD